MNRQFLFGSVMPVRANQERKYISGCMWANNTIQGAVALQVRFFLALSSTNSNLPLNNNTNLCCLFFFKINLCHMTSFSAKAHKASDCTWMSCVPGLHMIEIIASLDSTGIKQKELDHHGLKTNQRSTYWP